MKDGYKAPSVLAFAGQVLTCLFSFYGKKVFTEARLKHSNMWKTYNMEGDVLMNETCSQIIFKSKRHKEFYEKYLPLCRYADVYHAALVYCLGIDEDTRKHVTQIYDFKTGCVNTNCLHEGWQTSGSSRIVRMAFNLYNNGTPSVYDYENSEEKLDECQRYTVEDLFCCGYARYFWQAIQIRYPEYCGAA